MAGHEIEKGEVQPFNPTERLHNDMRKQHESQIQGDTPTTQEQGDKDCTDQLLECTSECDINDKECETECVENYHECEYPWEEEQMTTEEDKFMAMDEGELISEILQITALLGGTCTRTSTLDSTGRESKKVIIEYDIRRRDKTASQET